MAKKPAQTVKVSLSGDAEHCWTALYKNIELKPGALRFLHLERKGNTWLLLDAVDTHVEEWEIFQVGYIGDPLDDKAPRKLSIGGMDVEIRAYTVIHLPGQAFYHLDELPDGSWRITHSDALLHCDHNSLHHLSVRKV